MADSKRGVSRIGPPPEGERVENPLTRTGGSSFFPGLRSDPFNPDEIARTRGGIGIYQRMLGNPYVKAALTRKKGEALAPGYVITAASDAPEHLRQADFVRWVLDPKRKTFQRDLWQMLDGLDVGYSLTEPVWDQVPRGEWSGFWYIRDFKSKDPADFDILTDQYRNVVGFRESWRVGNSRQEYPSDAMILFSWMPRYENPYGTSDLRAAYRAYWSLVNLWNARLKYLERFARPTPHGKHPRQITSGQRDAFWNALTNWMDETVIMTTNEYEIDLKEAVTDGEAYEKAQERLAMEILIAILGSHLAITEGALQGAKAQGEVHESTASIMVGLVRLLVECEVNRQIVCPLVDYNFGPQDSYPVWQFDRNRGLSQEEAQAKQAFMSVVQTAMLSGVTVSVEWLREAFDIPEPGPGEVPAVPVPQPGMEVGLPALTRDRVARVEGEPGEGGPGGGEDESGGFSGLEDETSLTTRDLGGVSAVARRILDQTMGNLAGAEALARETAGRGVRAFKSDLGAELKKKRNLK